MASSLKVGDIKELQELVSEHLEVLEPGLTLLDTGAHLGGATMDLVALDSHGVLTLIALGFVAEDEVVLRALEAYSWCLEYPAEVQKLYPAVGVSSPQPPRVLFIVERTSDGFVRKLKHVRFDRVECMEFHFGLSFTRLDVGGGGEAAGRPAAATVTEAVRARTRPAASVTESAPARPRSAPTRRAEDPPLAKVPIAADPHSDLTAGLQMPDELSPEWRAAVSPPARGVDDTKVSSVREYLQKEFPTAIIYDFYASDRSVQVFHLQDNQGVITHSATVAEDLLNASTEAQLRQFFDKHKLARMLRQAGQAGVSVTKAGLKVERR